VWGPVNRRKWNKSEMNSRVLGRVGCWGKFVTKFWVSFRIVVFYSSLSPLVLPLLRKFQRSRPFCPVSMCNLKFPRRSFMGMFWLGGKGGFADFRIASWLHGSGLGVAAMVFCEFLWVACRNLGHGREMTMCGGDMYQKATFKAVKVTPSAN